MIRAIFLRIRPPVPRQDEYLVDRRLADEARRAYLEAALPRLIDELRRLRRALR